jgi:hypothetical protein
VSGFDGPGVLAVYSALTSHAKSLNIFQDVNRHESDNPPAGGAYCSFLLGDGEAIRASGMTATSIRQEFTARIYVLRQQRPLEAIDPAILTSTMLLVAAYSADFTLASVPAGLVRNVDLLGATGQGLSWRPGYLEQDGSTYRVMDVLVPLILNDAFAQVAT